MPDQRCVLDASAIVAWLLNERGADAVGRILQYAVLPAPNVAESILVARRHGHRMTTDQLYARLYASCAGVEPFVDGDAPRAAELLLYADREANQQLSLGDALCIAVAERLQLPLVSDDGLWTQLPLEVAVHLFRR